MDHFTKLHFVCKQVVKYSCEHTGGDPHSWTIQNHSRTMNVCVFPKLDLNFLSIVTNKILTETVVK